MCGMDIALRTIADGVHTVVAPQRFYGVEVGARMTLLELSTGTLVHAPLQYNDALRAEVGVPRWVVAPNKLHHLYIGPWIEAGAEAWAAPGLAEKRQDLTFTGTLGHDSPPFGDELAVIPLTCFPFTNEVLFLHRPSRTLIVTDLVFHFTSDAPMLTRAAMFCLCGYPGCRTTLLERAGFHRETARRELAPLLALDFDRPIMAHGEVIETGGKEALVEALSWLGIRTR